MKTNKLLIALVVAMCFTSCVKETLYDRSRGATLTVTTDWSDRTDGIEIPTAYLVFVGDHSETVSGLTNTLNKTFMPDTHRVKIFNSVDHINIDGHTATVTTTDNKVHTEPGWLFSYSGDVVLVTGENTHTAPKIQQVRQLSFELTIKGIDPELVQGVTAVLDGVANSWDLDRHVIAGTPVQVAPPFTRTADKLNSTVRLIGMFPASTKTMAFNVTFTSGHTTTVQSDLTSKLIDFNTNKSVPMLITSDLTFTSGTGGDPEFTGTITNWVVTTEDIRVN